MAPTGMLWQGNQAERAAMDAYDPQCLSEVEKAKPFSKDWARAMVLKVYGAWQTTQDQTYR